MEGYDAATYGDRFVDVYDDWYGSITDTEACVDALDAQARALAAARGTAAGPARILELGVGTGRLAIPLARRGHQVTGLDASAAMLAALVAKPGGDRVTAVLGDMTDPAAGLAGPADDGTEAGFELAFVAYNTLFNLVGDGDQGRCLAATAALLAPHGRLVVEAFVPDPDAATGDAVTPRRVTADRVVLSVSRNEPGTQEVLGQYVDITEAGIKLRPWHIRWATTDQLDALARSAGLTLDHRSADWNGAPFGPDAAAHVSTYRRTDP